jgi:four helix bundle protein
MPEPRVAARTFRDLLVWRKAHQFVLGVYSFTAAFPKPETYGLSLQMRRAAVSIPANIAEGFRRRGKADKARYMNIAEGSLEECRYYLILANDLGYGNTDA